MNFDLTTFHSSDLGQDYVPLSFGMFDYSGAAPATQYCRQLAELTGDPQSVPGLRVECPPDGALRMRRLVHRGAPRPTSRMYSLTLDRHVECESQLEVDGAQLLDACPRVLSFAEQPVKLHFTLAGRTTWHIPDVAVKTAKALEFIEFKYARDVDRAVLERTTRLQSLLSPLGVGYRLLTEFELHAGVALDNAHRLLRRGRERAPMHWALQVGELLRSECSVPLEYFGWSNLGSAEAGWIARLILEGGIHIDLRRPLRGNNPVYAATSIPNQENRLWPSAASK